MLRTEPRPLTVHDFRELPEGPPFYQLIEGDVYMSPSPSRTHQSILRKLAALMDRYLERKPIGHFYFAPFDVYLTDLNAFEPDLLFVCAARRSIIKEHGIEGAPDLVVEILSPKTAKFDKGVKKEVYARTGVNELWIVDPDLRHVQVFRLQQAADVPVGTFGEAHAFESPLFPGLKIAVADLFED